MKKIFQLIPITRVRWDMLSSWQVFQMTIHYQQCRILWLELQFIAYWIITFLCLLSPLTLGNLTANLSATLGPGPGGSATNTVAWVVFSLCIFLAVVVGVIIALVVAYLKKKNRKTVASELVISLSLVSGLLGLTKKQIQGKVRTKTLVLITTSCVYIVYSSEFIQYPNTCANINIHHNDNGHLKI